MKTINVDIFQTINRGLSDSNVIRTHNHLVPKPTLNHLAKLACKLIFLNGWCLFTNYVIKVSNRIAFT